MPQTIQRPPIGLLTLLGLKAGGTNPSILPEEVGGSVELRELYEVRELFCRQVPITGAAIDAGVGTFIVGVGPLDDEIWHVKGINYRTDLGALPAAGFLQISLGIRDPVGVAAGPQIQLFGTSPLFVGATDAPAFGVECDIFLPAGWLCGMWVHRSVNAEASLLTMTGNRYKPV